jgi:hypothetical protein
VFQDGSFKTTTVSSQKASASVQTKASCTGYNFLPQGQDHIPAPSSLCVKLTLPPTAQHAPMPRHGLRCAAKYWFQTFPFQQFHVLFDSLFKVLFIFPSQYLFAIGLLPLFSLRWNIPPTLGCSPKQPDSMSWPTLSNRHQAHTGLSPSLVSCSKELCPTPVTQSSLFKLQFPGRI